MTWTTDPAITTPGRSHNEESAVPGRLDETRTIVQLPHVEAASPAFDWAVPTIEGEAPSGRGGHSGTLVGGRIFFFGGHYLEGKNFQYSNELYVLDVDNNKWLKPRVKGEPPIGRYNHATCLVEDKLYIFGGKSATGSLRDMHTLNVHTFAFDAAPETIRNSMTLGLPAARHGHSLSLCGPDQLVLFGGTNDSKFFNDVHVYDAKTHVWTCVSLNTHTPSFTSKNTCDVQVPGRALHAAAIIGDYLIVHGGITNEGEYLNDVKVFHLKQHIWSRLRTTGVPPSPRYGHTLSLSQSALVLVGGWQGLPYRCDLCAAPSARLPAQHRDFCTLKTRSITVAEKPGTDVAHYLDLAQLTWNAIAGGCTRYGHSSVSIGPHLVVFGGWDGNKAMADVCVLKNNATN